MLKMCLELYHPYSGFQYIVKYKHQGSFSVIQTFQMSLYCGELYGIYVHHISFYELRGKQI